MSRVNRRRLLSGESSSSSSSSGGTRTTRLAEVVGGTAAECAAICCCCPCVMLTVAFCVLYKLPAGILRRALKKRRMRRMMKRGKLSQPTAVLKRRCPCGCDEVELRIKHEKINTNNGRFEMFPGVDDNNNKDAMMMTELETEMWSRFYRTGFGRSHSQTERQRD